MEPQTVDDLVDRLALRAERDPNEVENLSADQGNAYFADGIQDEILTRLAKIGALKVISRTSTQQYASKPEIGRASCRERV